MNLNIVEIFILNYNGEDLLVECLPSFLEAREKSPVACTVTVIDNNSKDRSLSVLKERFPSVKVLALKTNHVLCAFNDAVRASAAQVVFLLNNDLKADPDFIKPLLDVFEKKTDAFLAAPKAFTFDGSRYEGSLSKMTFKWGALKVESRFEGYEKKIDTPGFTMQAGFGAYHRERFLALGGFDDLYLPGTVEDTDLCFRAWKAGFACYYAPESRMYHKGQVSFKKRFGSSRLLALNQRNMNLFIWKNISSPQILLSHTFWYFIRPLLFLLKGRPEFLSGAFQALGRIGESIKRRKSSATTISKRSDKEILKISEGI
jgi:N-acetylglucosaminyl-diphospho-decaprenol L-rhamnosyltransferase